MRKLRGRTLKVTLLLIPVIASSLAPMLALIDTVEAQVYSIVLWGKDGTYNTNASGGEGIKPWKEYPPGSRPPIMVAKRMGTGAVVAAGFVPSCRGKTNDPNNPPRWNDPDNPHPHIDVLLDKAFQWMKSRATEVLWYEGYGVYNNRDRCSDLVAALTNRGYNIGGDSRPFREINLPAYDILVIPQLQLGARSTGGDPSLLPDADVTAIKDFVEGGGGLLIMEGSDFQGYNFYKVQNKILENFNFGIYFQHDAVYANPPDKWGDDWETFEEVGTATDIGAAYQSELGKTVIGLYSTCSLAELGPSITVYIIPEYQVGMPGETITYRVRVLNTGIPTSGAENVDLTIDLTVDDDSDWSLTLDNYLLRLPENENQTVILSVTVPSNTRPCTEDEITVTATAREYPVSDDYVCIAHAAKRLETTEDAYVTDNDPDGNFGDKEYLRVGRYKQYWQYAYLKFDNLVEIPSDANVIEARLYLFCWDAYGGNRPILCCGVENDNWLENEITWNNKPNPGTTLDTNDVGGGTRDEPKAYFWDVTSFVQHEFAGDKVASFCVRPADDHPENNTRQFESDNWWDNRLRPFLRIIYTTRNVSVSISPSYKSGLLGGNVTFIVTVKNEGDVSDTYSLSTTDNAGWSSSVSPTSLTVPAKENRTATLTVAIPSDAENCTRDNIRVTATGTGVSAENSCIAHAITEIIRGIQVSISPAENSAENGRTVTFVVTVRNKGNVTEDFNLNKIDTHGWTLTLSATVTGVIPGENRQVILSVGIPSTAQNCMRDNITVTATSTENAAVSGSANCIAHAVSVVGRVKVTIDQASKSGEPGESLNYSVTVKNEGTNTDNFSLHATDTKGWGPTLSITSIPLPGGSSRTGIRLSIKIPDNAADGDSTTITVTARGTGYENSATCTAKAASGGISLFVYVVAAVVVVVIIAAVLIVKPF